MSKLTNTIIAYNDFEDFKYDIIIDWAIELLEENISTDTIQIVAGLQKPINVFEARKYIETILKDIDIPEYSKDKRIFLYSEKYVRNIADGIDIRTNLGKLSRICTSLDYEKIVYDFSLLYWAWDDLDYQDFQYYYPNANRDNIEAISKNVAIEWLQKK